MTSISGPIPVLDFDRVKRVFDLAGNYLAWTGGNYTEDPYPVVGAASFRSPGPPGHRPRVDGHRRTDGVPWPPVPRHSPLLCVQLGGVRRCLSRSRSLCLFSGCGRRPGGRDERHQQHALHGRGRAPPLPGPGPALLRSGPGPLVGRELDRADRPRSHRLLRREWAGRVERRVLRCHPGAHNHRKFRSARRAGSGHPGVGQCRSRASDRDNQSDSGCPPGEARGRSDQRLGPVGDHRRRRDYPSPDRCRDLLVLPASTGRRLGHDVEADGNHPGSHPPPPRGSQGDHRATGRSCGPLSRNRCGGCRPIRCSPAG